MPFTLAHPIAVLPVWQLTQRKLDLPALMMGAMMPDVSYFLALQTVPNIGHSMAGIFLEGIPSGLMLLLLGRYLLWPPVLSLLPEYVSDRTASATYSFLPLSRFFNIVLSLAIGALTHIFWDSFTHKNGWAVQHISWLSSELLGLSIYKWLQYGGGVVGLCLLALVAFNTLQNREPHHRYRALSGKQSVVAAVLISVVASEVTLQAISAEPAIAGLNDIVVRFVIGSVSGTFLGLCLYAVLFWLISTVSRRIY